MMLNPEKAVHLVIIDAQVSDMATITVEIINEKAYRLLEDLADLHIIRIHPSTANLSANGPVTPRFGFARDMIGRIADDFNEPLDEFADYQP